MLRVPLERLPPSAVERHGVLRDYFCDKDAQAQRKENCWELTLHWPEGNERHVDPRLQEGLDWWDHGLTLAAMVLAWRRSGRILTSLYDTWTLHSWSQWLARHPRSVTEGLVVLHVDDHRDLAPPRLFVEDGVLRDAVNAAPVDLGDSESVRQAILSGALGMGSFLTPFLYFVPNTEVRQLCQPPKATMTRDFRILATTQADTLLCPGAPRPAVLLEPQRRATGPGCYRVTPNVDAWLDAMGKGPILLHIDMDYFNNRYDGDTDWRERARSLDPPLGVVLTKIDELTQVLRNSGVGPRIEDIVISYSPGFFPAEFWGAADARIRPGLELLHER
jgi:hypothetical protein